MPLPVPCHCTCAVIASQTPPQQSAGQATCGPRYMGATPILCSGCCKLWAHHCKLYLIVAGSPPQSTWQGGRGATQGGVSNWPHACTMQLQGCRGGHTLHCGVATNVRMSLLGLVGWQTHRTCLGSLQPQPWPSWGRT